ncbi:MAG: energy transducer TonB [Candidatus Thioglobus sp.]|jgi:protein TonB|nr:energy transducer TonB [Candidatus Thioglobus sp.]|tara:strand:+ start:61 stop:447 length:387 start_codon:yes stop_codon:yes gene_type:complete
MTWNKTLRLSFFLILIGIFSNVAFSQKVLEGYVGEDRTVINVTKIFDAAPTYPRNAIRLGREGYVLIEFDVDTDGSVLDPYVLESEPTGVFERSAIKAVRKWLFSPPSYKDVSVKVNDVRAKVTFALN